MVADDVVQCGLSPAVAAACAGPQTRVVRSYGLYHHTHATALGRCRVQVGQPPVVVPVPLDWQTACAQRGAMHPERCPACGQLLVCTGVIPRGGAPPRPRRTTRGMRAAVQGNVGQSGCVWRSPCVCARAVRGAGVVRAGCQAGRVSRRAGSGEGRWQAGWRAGDAA